MFPCLPAMEALLEPPITRDCFSSEYLRQGLGSGGGVGLNQGGCSSSLLSTGQFPQFLQIHWKKFSMDSSARADIHSNLMEYQLPFCHPSSLPVQQHRGAGPTQINASVLVGCFYYQKCKI